MLLVLGCFISFVYAFGENSFITHLVLSPKRLAFSGTPCSATMFLTDGVTGSSPVSFCKDLDLQGSFDTI